MPRPQRSQRRTQQVTRASLAEEALQAALKDTTPDLWRALSSAAAQEQARGESPEFGWASLNLIQDVVVRHLTPDVQRSLAGEMDYAQILKISCLPALLNWSLTRGSYEFEPELLSALARTPLREVPRHLLTRLPEYAVHVAYQGRLFGREVDGVFLYPALHEGTLHLHCATHWREERETHLSLQFIALSDPDLQTSLNLTYETNRAEREQLGVELALSEERLRHSRESAQLCLNLALYLSAEEPDLSGHRRTPPRPGRAERPGSTHVLQAGVRFATTLRQALAAGGAEPSSSGTQGARPRAVHTRAAHWHLYRTGPGRQEMKLHWLHPIIVGAQAMQEGQTLPVTVRTPPRTAADPRPPGHEQGGQEPDHLHTEQNNSVDGDAERNRKETL